jgi:hypothetical protein
VRCPAARTWSSRPSRARRVVTVAPRIARLPAGSVGIVGEQGTRGRACRRGHPREWIPARGAAGRPSPLRRAWRARRAGRPLSLTGRRRRSRLCGPPASTSQSGETRTRITAVWLWHRVRTGSGARRGRTPPAVSALTARATHCLRWPRSRSGCGPRATSARQNDAPSSTWAGQRTLGHPSRLRCQLRRLCRHPLRKLGLPRCPLRVRRPLRRLGRPRPRSRQHSQHGPGYPCHRCTQAGTSRPCRCRRGLRHNRPGLRRQRHSGRLRRRSRSRSFRPRSHQRLSRLRQCSRLRQPSRSCQFSPSRQSSPSRRPRRREHPWLQPRRPRRRPPASPQPS